MFYNVRRKVEGEPNGQQVKVNLNLVRWIEWLPGGGARLVFGDDTLDVWESPDQLSYAVSDR